MCENSDLTPSSDVHAKGTRRTWTMADQFASYHGAKAAAKARGHKFIEPGQKRFQMPIHLFMADPQDTTLERPSPTATIAMFLGCDTLEQGGAGPIVKWVRKRQDAAGKKTHLVESDNSADHESGIGLVITEAEQLIALEKDLHKKFPGFYVKSEFIYYPE